MGGRRWAERAYEAFDVLAWLAKLNLAWLAATLAGGVVLGLGPATLAAHELVRRRQLGESVPVLRTFIAALGATWTRGLAIGLPLEATWVSIAANWLHFSVSQSPASRAAAGLVGFLAVYLAAITCIAFPLAARYEVRGIRALLLSSRFALRQLPGVALLLFITAAVLFASGALPGLVPFASGGTWIMLTGFVGHRLFEANDAAVAGAQTASPRRGADEAGMARGRHG